MTTTPHLVKPGTQVNTTDGDKNQFESEITPLQDGGYVVVWTDLSRTYNPLGEAVVGQRYNSAGNKVSRRGGEVHLSQFTSGDQFSPGDHHLANGDIAVAFVDLFSGNSDITCMFSILRWILSGRTYRAGLNQTFHPSLTALADGGYVVSYTLGPGPTPRSWGGL